MATATLDRPTSRTIKSATALPEERLGMGEDGHPVKYWDVDGESVAFSLRPFEPSERKVYWNPQGPGAPMWWRAQERNDQGRQVIIQRECWVDGSFSPRNAWEEHMTVEWLRKSVDGGSLGHTWVGFDHPKNKDLKPGEQPHRWICGTCGYAVGPWAVLEQHQLSKRHSGLKNT
jgi:hypothetical protein